MCSFKESPLALEDDLLSHALSALLRLKSSGFRPYGQASSSRIRSADLEEYGDQSAEELATPVNVRVAGRIHYSPENG